MILKNIILLFVLLLAVLFFSFNTNHNKDTEVVITIPTLTPEDISFYLKNEFDKHPKIEFIDGSTETKTIVLNVNQHDFNQNHVEDLLNKWGCKPTSFDFNSLALAD